MDLDHVKLELQPACTSICRRSRRLFRMCRDGGEWRRPESSQHIYRLVETGRATRQKRLEATQKLQ